MPDTNLTHLETEQKVTEVPANNRNVVICCGRMGPICIPVYGIMEQLEAEYPHVTVRDLDFDIPAAGSGELALKGAAARSGQVGGEAILLTYARVDGSGSRSFKRRVVRIDGRNRMAGRGKRRRRDDRERNSHGASGT